jgi:O-antigen biosynthesis protein
MERITVRAKFFFEGDQKFRMQGVTYGPFRPRQPDGPHLPAAAEVRKDFTLMRDLGINTLRIYHTPPSWFLDLAAEFRIRVMVTIPWVKRVLFLNDQRLLREIRQNLVRAVKANVGHPALMGYFIDNEIPADLARWYGPRKMEAFLDSLVALVKKHDQGALAAYANFPPTEYVIPSTVDFLSYNVYLHDQKTLSNYLGRLQNLAGDKPLVLSEFGMDTIRHPEEEQAELLANHVNTVFQSGLAGTIIFSWTDEWFTDGVDVTDWAFGLVKTDRTPKRSYHHLKSYLSEPERPLPTRFPLTKTPKVSVVVCSYNGARTLEDCLRSLEKLKYPDYEVIFVDDGSKDHSQAIAQKFPWVKNIRQENKGLSVARNVGIEAAQGEIVAFTDSDCMVDEDWLYFLVHGLQSSARYAAVGGPNISPPATDWVQATVAAAPGSPSHVLITDTEAEHIPGCNMAYYKWALMQIGGFDPEYRKAGDDVDVCWRIMQLGYAIGFSPAAVVWHYRRFTVKAYFGQQKGYGEAEALLRYKHLNYFGSTGSALWHGRVYSQVRLDSLFSRPIIYHGVFGTGFFQCLYPQPESPWGGLLGSLEWFALSTFVLLLSIPLEPLRLLPLIMFGLLLLAGLSYMTRARIEPQHDTIRARLLLFYLAIAQPLARGWARYFTWLKGKSTPLSVVKAKETDPHATTSLWSIGSLSFWSEGGKERHHLLEETVKMLESEGWNYAIDTGWAGWDLHLFASRWWNIRLLTMTEIYPQGKRLTRVGNHLHMSTLTMLASAVILTASLLVIFSGANGWWFSLSFPAVFILFLVLHGVHLRYRVAELVQVAGIRAGLQPVSGKSL